MNKKNITQERILAAAANVFAREGLENTSIDEIASEAGVAKGTIYNYFKNKEELLVEGVCYATQQRIQLLRKILQKHPDPYTKLQVLLKANNHMFEQSKEMFVMNYALLLSTHGSVKERATKSAFRMYVDFVEELVIDGMRNGVIRKENSRVIALTLIVTQDLGNILGTQDSKIVSKKHLYNSLISLVKK